MSIFSWLIERKATAAVDEYFKSEKFDQLLTDAVARAVKAKPLVRFVKAMQMEMIRIDPTMDMMEAWKVGIGALNDFLHIEKINFGDWQYDWSDPGAVSLIHSMEIDHWETKP